MRAEAVEGQEEGSRLGLGDWQGQAPHAQPSASARRGTSGLG